MSTKVGFITMGCPKNQVDTELMLSRLEEKGYEIVEEDIEADVMICNTCAFIKSAKEESIEAIMDLGWLKKNRELKGIVVTGCLAQRYYDEIKEQLPEVDCVLGLGAEADICEAVEKIMSGEEYNGKKTPPEELVIEGSRVLSTPEYYAYLKIAEGCDNHCAYCAIPGIRGRFRSRPMESIIEEARQLSSIGVKEICIVAQDTTRYGLDLYGDYKLAELLEKLCTDDKITFEWIRLMYCYPDKITDELCEVIAKYDKIAKYIDLPIQHISDKVLTAMNRHGGSDAIKTSVKKLRAKVPDIAIRTTVLVGFPGETDKDVKELKDYISETKFTRLGAFAYSREEGTPAYSFDKRVSEKTKELRVENIMDKQYSIQLEANEAMIGKKLRVLCEGFDKVSECYFGRTQYHAPEIDGGVYFTSARKLTEGEFVNVLIEDVMDYDLVGRAVRS